MESEHKTVMFRIWLVLVTAVWTSQMWSSTARIYYAPLKLRQCLHNTQLCVELKYCPKLANNVYLSQDKTRAMSFIERYSCGLHKDVLQVCCERHLVSESSGIDPSELVRGHQNLDLINQQGCGMSQLSNRIIGGEDASVGEFLWMAILIYKNSMINKTKFQCGGSLISDRFVLTAAHCLVFGKTSDSNLIRVRLGEFNMNSEFDCQRNARGSNVCAPIAKEYSVAKIIPHPYFNPDNKRSHHHDIGLIKLNPSVQLSSSIVPICLPVPYQTKQVTPNTPLIVAGWGMGEMNIKSYVLQKLNVSAMSNEVCEIKLQRWGHVEKSQLCAAGVEGTNAYIGDSGGPLMSFGVDGQHYQVGILSFGYAGNKINPVLLYTKIEPFLRWILDNMDQSSIYRSRRFNSVL